MLDDELTDAIRRTAIARDAAGLALTVSQTARALDAPRGYVYRRMEALRGAGELRQRGWRSTPLGGSSRTYVPTNELELRGADAMSGEQMAAEMRRAEGDVAAECPDPTGDGGPGHRP